MSEKTLLVDGPALAAHFGIPPGTIRNWAHKGRLTRRGSDSTGRTLYDLDEAEALITGRRTPRRGRGFRDETDYLDDNTFGPFEPADYGDRQ